MVDRLVPIPTIRLSPSAIKKRIVIGNATKLDMKTKISSMPIITNRIDIDKLTEHEIDAIAMALILYTDITKNKVRIIKKAVTFD